MNEDRPCGWRGRRQQIFRVRKSGDVVVPNQILEILGNIVDELFLLGIKMKFLVVQEAWTHRVLFSSDLDLRTLVVHHIFFEVPGTDVRQEHIPLVAAALLVSTNAVMNVSRWFL